MLRVSSAGRRGAKVVAGLAPQLVADGHEVDVVTSGWKELASEEMLNGVRVHRVKSIRTKVDRCNPLELASYVIAAFPVVRSLLKRRQYDVCNCHFIFPDGLLAHVVKRAGVPVLVTAHGSDVPGYNPDRFQLLHWLLSPLWRYVIRQANEIGCPSPTLERLILSRVSDAPTTVIPNGFDPLRFDPGLDRKNRILVVSRLFRRKGIHRVIAAFSDIDSNYELHIVGDGPYRGELESLAAKTDKVVHFWGWLNNSDPRLKQLYESSSIFALPSDAENFPVCLLEAMASGLAVITSSGTGCADVVGDAGLLVSPDDVNRLRAALTCLIEDPDLTRQLGAAARQRVEDNFTWPKVSSQYVAAFERITTTKVTRRVSNVSSLEG